MASHYAPSPLVGTDYVDFSWPPTDAGGYTAIRDYVIEVGSSRTDPGYYRTADVFSSYTGGSTFYKWKSPSVIPGQYWVRIRTKNDCGLSAPSLEARFSLR